MGDGYTDIAGDGTIGEVTLHAADGEFVAEVFKDGIRQPQIAFCVLEINRIDLVGHRTGAHFTGFDFLLKILH